MAVTERAFLCGALVQVAVGINRFDFYASLRNVLPVSACVHVDGSAEASGNACKFMNPGKAILLTIMTFLSLFLIVVFPPCLLVLPFAAAYLRVYICERIFDKAIEDEKDRRERSSDENVQDLEDKEETDA